jgi:hypothetical protein
VFELERESECRFRGSCRFSKEPCYVGMDEKLCVPVTVDVGLENGYGCLLFRGRVGTIAI